MKPAASARIGLIARVLWCLCLFPLSRSGRLSAAEVLDYGRAAALAVSSSAELSSGYALLDLRGRTWWLGFLGYLPTLTLEAGEADRLNPLGADSFGKTWTLSGEQVLWDGGRRRAGREEERAALASEKDRLDRQGRALKEEALAQYRLVLTRRAARDIRRSTVEFLQAQREILEAELSGGLVTASDLRRAGIDLAEAGVESRGAELEVRAAEREFCRLIGLGGLPALTESIDRERGCLPVDEAALLALARLRNPDIATRRHSLAIAESTRKAGAAEWRPVLSLSVSLELSGERYPLVDYALGASLTLDFQGPWVLGEGGLGASRRQGAIASANSSASLSFAPEPETLLEARNAGIALELERKRCAEALAALDASVQLALETYRLAGERTDLARSRRDLAREDLDLGQLRLSLGQITRIDLIGLRLELAEAELSLLVAAAALLERERALEALADLECGGLARLRPR